MEQLNRIRDMEESYREASAILPALQAALDAYACLRPRLTELDAYYTSPAWKADFAADEAGELPPDLPRGVLSEDGLWDLLQMQRSLQEQMADLAQK